MEPEKKITTDLAPKNLDAMSFFEKDGDFVFAYKKTEKLAMATYMVTNLFSENEPIKWSLRKKVSDLLSFMLNYKNVSDSNKSDFVNNVKTRVLEIVSLIEVSFCGGLISEMNYSILKQEFSNLLEVFDRPRVSPTDFMPGVISKSFFNIENTEQYSGYNNKNVPNQMSYIGIKDKNDISGKDGLKRSNRQNVILGLLKKKKELTIKDIALVIKDCSEKTIQRELITFIAEGVIKRTGERRWSKYSLNGNHTS